MARHSFIVELDVSTEDSNQVKNTFKQMILNWLDNVNFVTHKDEQLVHINQILPSGVKIKKEETDGKDT